MGHWWDTQRQITTIKGNIVKMWHMFDYNSVQEVSGIKYLSLKTQDEYDCEEEQRRALYFSWHNENIGKGKVVYIVNETAKNWIPVPPDSVYEAIWEFACGKLMSE